MKTGFAYEYLTLFNVIENALTALAQRSALKNTFCVLYVSQRRLITLSVVIMAGLRVRWEKQLADIPLSFKLMELYPPVEMVQPLQVQLI